MVGARSAAFAPLCAPSFHYEDPLTSEPLERPDALASHAPALARVPDARVNATGARLTNGSFAAAPTRLLGTHDVPILGLAATHRELVVHVLFYAEPAEGRLHRCGACLTHAERRSSSGSVSGTAGPVCQHAGVGSAGAGKLAMHRAERSDAGALAEIDSVAMSGDRRRSESIRRWCAHDLVIIAEGPAGPLGYCVLEHTFFEQGFVTMLMVSPTARRRGVGGQLLVAAEEACMTAKLFTSTNVSNQPMQRLLSHAGWRPVGLLHGLDDDDPELFYLCPRLLGSPG